MKGKERQLRQKMRNAHFWGRVDRLIEEAWQSALGTDGMQRSQQMAVSQAYELPNEDTGVEEDEDGSNRPGNGLGSP